MIENNAKVALNVANQLSQCCILQMNVKIVYKLILNNNITREFAGIGFKLARVYLERF